MAWIKANWTILVTLLSVGIALGETQNKILTLEDAVKSNAATQSTVIELKSNQERVDERTIQMQRTQERQEKLLEIILQNQKNQNK